LTLFSGGAGVSLSTDEVASLIHFIPDWISPAIEADIEDVKMIYDLNLFSVLRVTNELVPLLMQSGRHRPTHIFNIGSIAGEMGNPYVSAYGSAKAALKAYGDSLNIELGPFK
jgi:short-subunit dehydrogenase